MNKLEKAIQKVEIIMNIPVMSGIIIPIIEANQLKDTVISITDIKKSARLIKKKI